MKISTSHSFFLIAFIVFLLPNISQAWDQEELEMFDLVEEVNENFYNVLGVPQNCSQGDIRKAYRRLSLLLHPDKNDAPDAELKFRQLVGIYEVLKDETRRTRYDQVLIDGVPNWRHPMYYYRRVRKMGMLELSIWLFVLFTIGQYLVGWASYFEKNLTLGEAKANKLKKLQKQLKKSKSSKAEMDALEEEMDRFVIPKPSYKNTLPFQLVRGIIALPALIRFLIEYRQERKREAEERKEQERLEAEELEREQEEMEREKEREKERKIQRRKRVNMLPVYNGEPDECILDAVEEPSNKVKEVKAVPRISGGLWTDDDLAELAKYMKKYPVGTPERWEKIADALNRSVVEVTHFAKKMKENAFRPPEGQDDENNAKEEERVERKKEKTRGGKNNLLLAEPTLTDPAGADRTMESAEQVAGSSGWTQKQQKSLETALACYTKGSSERWERIAKAVPGKTKEECMLRVKYLSDMVKKKKQQEEEDRLRSEGDESTISNDRNQPDQSTINTT